MGLLEFFSGTIFAIAYRFKQRDVRGRIQKSEQRERFQIFGGHLIGQGSGRVKTEKAPYA